jgi:hypothetical protein
VDGCRDAVTGATIVQATSTDSCLVKKCVKTTDAAGNVAAVLTVVPSAGTCAVPPNSSVRCYRVVFEDFRTTDVAAFRAKIGDAIISSFDQFVQGGRLVVYVCVKVPRARDVAAVCDPTAQACDVVLTAAASLLSASLLLLLALMFLL